jgi:uncharacterized damage-inducible protein DinB
MSSPLSRLIAHLGWADEAVLSALREAPAPAEDWLELFGHVLGAEHVWLTRLQGRPATVAVWPNLTIDDCEKLAKANWKEFSALVARLTPVDLDRSVHYRNSAGLEFDSRVEDILLHVSLHGCYHRGQIARAMRQGGAEPAKTDFIGYIRGVPAATRQR